MVPSAPEPSIHLQLHVSRLGVGDSSLDISPESRCGLPMSTPCPSGWSNRHLKLSVARLDLSITPPSFLPLQVVTPVPWASDHGITLCLCP